MSNELYHYGVPGMRWGVRKNPAMKSLNSHTKMVEKNKKAGNTINNPNAKKSGEKLSVDYKRSGHLTKPETTVTERYTVVKNPGGKKSSKDGSNKNQPKKDSNKKPPKEDKKTKDQLKEESTDKQVDANKNDKNNKPNTKNLEQVKKSVENIGKQGSSAFNEASKLASNSANKAKYEPSEKVKKELSEMSDAELNRRINRIKWEREYTALNPSEKAIARERTASVLATIGSLIAIGGSIASVAVSIKQLRAKNS